MANSTKKLFVFHEYDNGPVKYESFRTVLPTNTADDQTQKQNVINWARTFITSISKNDYGYVRLEEEISLNEILADL